MAAGEDGIEELLGEARHATLPFPFGRWVNPHCSFEITLEGTFEQKIAKQRTIRGQLRKDANFLCQSYSHLQSRSWSLCGGV